jgi:hypothetical protein
MFAICSHMPDSRVAVSTDELARTIAIWLTVLGQRRPSVLRDLWTRREGCDGARQDHARHELARYLAEKMTTARHEVTRRETSYDRLWRGVDRGEG